jgi:hypothetical protein
MLSNFKFSETSPSAPGSAASANKVRGSGADYLPAGVAGPIDDYDGIDILLDVQGATGGTLNVYVQSKPGDGEDWYDIVSFPTIQAGAAEAYFRAQITPHSGTSFPVQVGKNLSPALPPGTSLNGAFGSRLRLVMVAGAGTTAGAQVTCLVCAQRAQQA